MQQIQRSQQAGSTIFKSPEGLSSTAPFSVAAMFDGILQKAKEEKVLSNTHEQAQQFVEVDFQQEGGE